MAKEFSTPYSRAWQAFTQSEAFIDLVTAKPLDYKPDNVRYIHNRIREAFDAGWNAKTSSILEAMNQMSGRGKEA